MITAAVTAPKMKTPHPLSCIILHLASKTSKWYFFLILFQLIPKYFTVYLIYILLIFILNLYFHLVYFDYKHRIEEYIAGCRISKFLLDRDLWEFENRHFASNCLFLSSTKLWQVHDFTYFHLSGWNETSCVFFRQYTLGVFFEAPQLFLGRFSQFLNLYRGIYWSQIGPANSTCVCWLA